MIGKHPIGGAAPAAVIFDALADAGPVRAAVETGGVEMIGLAQLNAQGHVAGTGRPDRAADGEDISALDHPAHRQPQQPVKIRMPMLIAARGPAFPERIDLFVQRRIPGRRARTDTGADDIVHQHLHRLRGHRVVAHQITHAVAQERAICGDPGIGRGAAR